jgi:ABC-type bacteriocin/lantibiotic exporter with double-glycine peptidase domain
VQLWQNFLEAALSIDSLSDTLNILPEIDADNINNITMPPIVRQIGIENLTFSFPGTNGVRHLRAANANGLRSPGRYAKTSDINSLRGD